VVDICSKHADWTVRVTQRCGAPFVREYRRWITPGRTCLTNTWAKPPHHTLLPLHLLWQCCCSPVHPRLCKANSDGNDPTLTTAGRDGETPAGRRSRDSPSGGLCARRDCGFDFDTVRSGRLSNPRSCTDKYKTSSQEPDSPHPFYPVTTPLAYSQIRISLLISPQAFPSTPNG